MKNLIIIIIFLFTFTSATNHAQDLKQKIKFKLKKKINKLSIDNNHKTYMGQIVFSKDRIPFKNVDDSQFITNTSFENTLFFRQYWDQTMEEAYKENFKGEAWDNAALLYEISIDGKKVSDYIDYTNSGKENTITWYTTWADISVPRPSETRGNKYSDILLDIVTQNKYLIQGKNVLVALNCYIYDGETNTKGSKLAEGSIKIDFSKSNLSVYNTNSSDTQPRCMPKSQMNDPALASLLLKATKVKGWKEKHLLAVINTADFTTLRHSLTGIIEGRSVGANVAAKRGSKCFYQRFTYTQGHNGNQYSGTWILEGIGEQKKVPCSCLQGI